MISIPLSVEIQIGSRTVRVRKIYVFKDGESVKIYESSEDFKERILPPAISIIYDQ